MIRILINVNFNPKIMTIMIIEPSGVYVYIIISMSTMSIPVSSNEVLGFLY